MSRSRVEDGAAVLRLLTAESREQGEATGVSSGIALLKKQAGQETAGQGKRKKPTRGGRGAMKIMLKETR